MATKGVVRIGDLGDGACGETPAVAIEGSTNVFVNGIGVHRVGDAWASHPSDNPHAGRVLSSGSTTVFVNGKGVAREDDPISCGAKADEHSPNVFSG